VAIVSTQDQASRTVTVLGSTGSIGTSTLALLETCAEPFFIEALTANRNVALLAAQAKKYRPSQVVIADPAGYSELQSLLAGSGIIVASGQKAVEEVASQPVDWTMAAIVGIAGLRPTMAAAKASKVLALANKESLVCAGKLLLDAVKHHNTQLIPVDSEHSAIFQLWDGAKAESVETITLTASGGPFRTWSTERMASVTPAQAVAHPNWSMGAKISVDSATMMNKGLELIEAYHLFPLEASQIEVLVHPESVIHGMVTYRDGSVLAQLGTPDMTTPIAVALNWPLRKEGAKTRLDLKKLGSLTFEAPDIARFPALRLAREALDAGGDVPIILNAANEGAVAAFLQGKIGFLDIVSLTEQVIQACARKSPISHIDDVIQADANARDYLKRLIPGDEKPSRNVA
jgi:1-deoxy-D-xylulose-5-phosphate reductoisomerase